MKDKKVLIIVLIVVLLLCLCSSCALGGFFLWRNYGDEIDWFEPEKEEENDIFDDISDELIDEINENLNEDFEVDGLVTGEVTYPSEFIPDDLEVCAEDVVTMEETCTDMIYQDSDYGYYYELILDPGTYYVYAYVESVGRAYYTEFVRCGLSVDCVSHDKIEVEVESGDYIVGIDPGDWYE